MHDPVKQEGALSEDPRFVIFQSQQWLLQAIKAAWFDVLLAEPSVAEAIGSKEKWATADTRGVQGPLPQGVALSLLWPPEYPWLPRVVLPWEGLEEHIPF